MLESGLGSVSASKLVSMIYQEHGLKGLYCGFTATALCEFGYGAYFLGVSALITYFPWLTSWQSTRLHVDTSLLVLLSYMILARC